MRLFLLIIFICFFSTTKAQTAVNDTADCLAVVGTFNNKKNVKDVWAYLFRNNEVVDSVKTYTKKGFAFILKPNQHYSIMIIKEGYYSRLVSISTVLPPGVVPKPVFIFGFKCELLKRNNEVDDYWLDFPIAQVAYDPTSKIFDYDKKYTQTIKDELVKLGLIRSGNRKPSR